MSRSNSLGDFDVITGPPAPSRPIPPASLPSPPSSPAPPAAAPATTPNPERRGS